MLDLDLKVKFRSRKLKKLYKKLTQVCQLLFNERKCSFSCEYYMDIMWKNSDLF